MTGSWDALAKVRLVAVADLHAGGVCLGGYHLAYPAQYSGATMPPWMENTSAGELKVEDPATSEPTCCCPISSRRRPP
ncbi:MAG: hypothetical protein MZW92_15030 [Comamonadaceae bacterium]|nr:hypothetical protein [Comamonadaceae bacterium]